MKKATSGLPVAVDAGGELADFGQMPPQGRVAQPAELRKRLAGQQPRARRLAVVVQLVAADGDPRGRDHLLHLVRRLRQAG